MLKNKHSAENWPIIVERAIAGELDVSDIAELAYQLAKSGRRLDSPMQPTADLASTGGPTSLSTILVPPMLAAAGWAVPKLGVNGRPAGGVDSLACINGYEVGLDAIRAKAVLDECGYVHVVAGNEFAPADAALFRYRQAVGAQAVPALAIASLLAKKLAMSVRRVGLEVRVAEHGNFGSDIEAASASAALFCKVAEALELEPVCILTDAAQPFQPYIGRGEALLALARVIDSNSDDWLTAHVADCTKMASIVDGARASSQDAAQYATIICKNIEAQGGTLAALRQRAEAVASAHIYVIRAAVSGPVDYDLGTIRAAIMEAQGTSPKGWPDDAGVILRARPGEQVHAGQQLMTARCPEVAWPSMRATLAAAASIGHLREVRSSSILEVVGV